MLTVSAMKLGATPFRRDSWDALAKTGATLSSENIQKSSSIIQESRCKQILRHLPTRKTRLMFHYVGHFQPFRETCSARCKMNRMLFTRASRLTAILMFTKWPSWAKASNWLRWDNTPPSPSKLPMSKPVTSPAKYRVSQRNKLIVTCTTKPTSGAPRSPSVSLQHVRERNSSDFLIS